MPESDQVLRASMENYSTFDEMRSALLQSDEFRQMFPAARIRRAVGGTRKTVLVQNYHGPATMALIRDFKKLGLRVVAPDSNWGRIEYYSDNVSFGGDLISYEDYMALPAGLLLIGCKAHEMDMKAIAAEHGDKIILNVAQHEHYYQAGISDVLICPDITVFESYPSDVKFKMLYFPRPHLSLVLSKDHKRAFDAKCICSYISLPDFWKAGTATLQQFAQRYPNTVKQFGISAPDGVLDHAECNRQMSLSYFTVHFKEQEAYGLSCLESMALGTPIVSLRKYMHDKTLGRFFLNDSNSILADTVEEAVGRLVKLDFQSYVRMSCNAQQIVAELTRDEVTVDRLRVALSL